MWLDIICDTDVNFLVDEHGNSECSFLGLMEQEIVNLNIRFTIFP
jgi:hypothetical protein